MNRKGVLGDTGYRSWGDALAHTTAVDSEEQVRTNGVAEEKKTFEELRDILKQKVANKN